MSTKAVSWALEQEGLPPTVKIVLIAMADAAGDSGKSFSSRDTLLRMTGHAKGDTITQAQERLAERGLIRDTGKRIGATGKVKVWQLHADACKVRPEPEALALFDLPATPNHPPNGSFNHPPNGSLEGGQSPANHPPITRQTGHPLTSGNGERGTAGGAAAPPQPPEASREPAQKPPTRQFSDEWCAGFLERFGAAYPYNGRDGKAAAELLKCTTPDEAIRIAKLAWKQVDDRKFWACVHQTSTVSAFAAAWPKIRVELARTGGVLPANASRNPWDRLPPRRITNGNG